MGKRINRGFKYVGNGAWQYRLPNCDIPYEELVKLVPDWHERNAITKNEPQIFAWDPPYSETDEQGDDDAKSEVNNV